MENDKFTFGVSNYPLLYSDVLYIKNTELDTLFGKNNEDTEYLEIGSWTLMDNYKVKININEFFAFHSAILGNTGSGKSCTISAILQSIYKDASYPRSQFIFFDINGEYKQAFIKSNNESKNEPLENIKFKYIRVLKEKDTNQDKFYLPLHLLTIDEWELLLKASAKAQSPIVRSALGLYSLCETSNKNSNDKDKIKTYIFCRITQNILNNPNTSFIVSRIISNLANFSNDILNKKINSKEHEGKSAIHFHNKGNNTPLFQDFGDLKNIDDFRNMIGTLEKDNYPKEKPTLFEYKNDCNIELAKLEEYIELAISWEEAHGNEQIRDYCSPLITRLKSLRQREEFKIFSSNKNEQPKQTSNVTTYVEQLIEDKNITIIDFDTIDDEIIEIVSSVLARLFFEYTKKNQEILSLFILC